MIEKNASRVGQPDGARCSHEQLRLNPMFERLDDPAYMCWRRPESFGAFNERPRRRDRNKFIYPRPARHDYPIFGVMICENHTLSQQGFKASQLFLVRRSR